ncbi:MAG TPA: precorrin-4 C(11)-methyltransferase [Syntrophorhabdaceae bacterium]|nr:precorrin-4 C(11)-methyltransferase [Syntrophorhabdaceae bacterium]
MSQVYFIGAGPGDPELMTIKGKKLLSLADVVIYTGSLVNPEVVRGLSAEIFDSSKLTLNQIVAIIKDSVSKNKVVVRLHTGDTSFYSAISEQIERLSELNIAYEVIPGVSSAAAGAATLGQELTIPEITQTVIITRLEGRTPVPQLEKLSELARHRATLVIFLSAGMIDAVVKELREGGYPEDVPVVVIEKASWPEERIIRGELNNIADKVGQSGITKTALIYVGYALAASDRSLGKVSRLYDKDFTHGHRK